jgi:hypothetical protein
VKGGIKEHSAYQVDYEPPQSYAFELYRDPELRKRAKDILGQQKGAKPRCSSAPWRLA